MQFEVLGLTCKKIAFMRDILKVFAFLIFFGACYIGYEAYETDKSTNTAIIYISAGIISGIIFFFMAEVLEKLHEIADNTRKESQEPEIVDDMWSGKRTK